MDKEGLSQRKAAKQLEDEQKEKLGEVVYSSQSLRRRYQCNRGPDMAQNGPAEPKYETCAVSDLHRLIRAGKKFGTIYADPP